MVRGLAARVEQRGESPFGSEEGSEDGENDQGGAGGAQQRGRGADPRTISEIQRSRINMARRYVFLCPTSLSKHFDALPHQAKDMALLVFRCSRAWFFQDPSEGRRAQTVSSSRVDSGMNNKSAGLDTGIVKKHPGVSNVPPLYHPEFTKEYMQWVVAKEKEGCVFWYKPEKDLHKMSVFFEEKLDQVSEHPYRPLLLDPQWWRIRFNCQSARYIANPAQVIQNITNAWDENRSIDVPALQELIYQSNPTLEPIEKWPRAPSMRFLPRAPTGKRDFVGKEAWCRGYVDNSRMYNSSGHVMASMSADQTRINYWPTAPRDRHDDLHCSWAKSEIKKERQQLFALSGKAALLGNAPPLTAR